VLAGEPRGKERVGGMEVVLAGEPRGKRGLAGWAGAGRESQDPAPRTPAPRPGHDEAVMLSSRTVLGAVVVFSRFDALTWMSQHAGERRPAVAPFCSVNETLSDPPDGEKK
jgi:hypothetical protein